MKFISSQGRHRRSMRHFIAYHPGFFELLLVIPAVALSLMWPSAGRGIYSFVERRFCNVYRRAWLAVMLAAILPAAMRLLLIPLWGPPEPMAHDEFGYLLTADTLHSGRLSTPTHPMWRHFETPTLIHFPTYASVYPVAQSLFLLIGIWLGHPWAGVVISISLLCGALCWMLRQWVPPGWAFMGAALFGLRFGVASYWINSYWGGASAATGSALVLGVLGWTLHRRRIALLESLLLGCGLVLLATSRPYEGFVLAIAAGIAFAVSFRGKTLRRPYIPAIASGLSILAVAGCMVALYNFRVTGSATRIPYQVSRAEYGIPIVFIWESLPPGRSSFVECMRDYYEWNTWLRNRYRTTRGAIRSIAGKSSTCFSFYIGPIFCIPLLAGSWILGSRRIRPLLLAGCIGIAGLLLEAYYFPHYSAPLLPIYLVVIIQGLRYLSTHRRWMALVPLVTILVVLMLLITVIIPNQSQWPLSWTTARVLPGKSRAALEQRLIQSGGSHLVIVQGGNHIDEWVFNTANIDSAPVVWAHDLGPVMNQEILDYYPNRQAWWISLQDSAPSLRPFFKGEAASNER